MFFGKIDVDNDKLSDLCGNELKIEAMPTFIVFKEGKEVERIVGADIKKVTEAVAKHK